MDRVRITRFARRMPLAAALAALAVVAALVAPGPVSAGTTTVQVGQQNGGSGAALQFNAASIVIRAGDTVHWTWFSGGSHTVTAWQETTPGTPDWGSGTICSGVCPGGSVTTFDHTFAAAGVYTYYCSFHALRGGADPANVDTQITNGLMVGKITVVEPAKVGGVAEAPDPASLAGNASRSRFPWLTASLVALASGVALSGAVGVARRVRRRRN